MNEKLNIKNIGKLIIVLVSGVILLTLSVICKILMKLDKEFEDQLKKEVKKV